MTHPAASTSPPPPPAPTFLHIEPSSSSLSDPMVLDGAALNPIDALNSHICIPCPPLKRSRSSPSLSPPQSSHPLAYPKTLSTQKSDPPVLSFFNHFSPLSEKSTASFLPPGFAQSNW